MPVESDVLEVMRRFFSLDQLPRLESHLLQHPWRLDTMPGPRNAHGYRADSFEGRDQINIAYLGCSWCEGMGVHRHQLFSEHASRAIARQTGMSVRSWNLGESGTGIDYIVRMVPVVCQALRPDFVVTILPWVDRREWFDAEGGRVSFQKTMGPALRDGAIDPPPALGQMIEQLDGLTNRFELITHYLPQLRAIHAMLNQAGVQWVHSRVTDSSGDMQLCVRLSEIGQWPSDNYLGTPFLLHDTVSPTDGHPGPESHARFGQSVAAWVLETIKSSGWTPEVSAQAEAASARARRGDRASEEVAADALDTPGDIYPLW